MTSKKNKGKGTTVRKLIELPFSKLHVVEPMILRTDGSLKIGTLVITKHHVEQWFDLPQVDTFENFSQGSFFSDPCKDVWMVIDDCRAVNKSGQIVDGVEFEGELLVEASKEEWVHNCPDYEGDR